MQGCGKRSIVLGAGLALALAGCSGGKPEQAAGQGNAAAPRAPEHNAAPPKAPPRAAPQAITAKSDAFEFSYKWPGEAAAIPDLDQWLRGNADKLRKRGQDEAQSERGEARKSGYPFNAHSYDEGYGVVADTDRMLVLLSDGYIYTGGAHGMPINTAIIWDKAAKRRLATDALINIPLFAQLANKRFCTELNKQRVEKRGEAWDPKDSDHLEEFDRCVNMTRELMVPISAGGHVLDTIRVVISPYDAGPYAEGSYVIDLALDRALLGAVKPDYRGAFGVR